MILETAAVVGAVAAATGGGLALRARSKRKAAAAVTAEEAQKAAVETAALAMVRAATPVKLTVTNGGRALIALWLSYRTWRASEAELRAAIYAALGLDEIPPHRSAAGVLLGLHLPIEMPGLPAVRGPDEMVARVVRAHDCERRKVEAAWMGGTREVELSPAMAAHALAGLDEYPIPANYGPTAAELIRQLRGLVG